ncbi:hypothetical protein CPB86DRAFT_228283 [Serendipita vermifera]|nr:hypothetical protein CPB86DRAFT_228283 [Serendipita vermifera]
MSKRRMYLHGFAGTGTSHLLAALAVKLIRDGQRVIYIPHCGELIEDFERTIRIALSFAFYDDPEAYSAIQSARNADDLLTFAEGNTDGYLIVDRLEILETRPDDTNPEAKEKVRVRLLKMISSHEFLYSSSANLPSLGSIGLWYTDAKAAIPFYEAMNQNEMTQWFNHYADRLPILNPQERDMICHVTGNLPLLLRPLFKFQGKPFDQARFLENEELVEVKKNVTHFFKEKVNMLRNELEKHDYLMLMDSLLKNYPLWVPEKKKYDLRYFSVRDDHSYCSCGVAAEALQLVFREFKASLAT